MMAHITRHLALGALCVVLGAALWMEMDGGAGSPAHGVVATKSPPAGVPDPHPVVTLPPLRTFGEIVARPLFWASRRPMTERAAAAPSDLAFMGVVMTQDDTVALVRHGKPPKIDRVREGTVLDGWKVLEVGLYRILLERGATRAELKRKDPHPAAPAGAARPSPSAHPVHPRE